MLLNASCWDEQEGTLQLRVSLLPREAQEEVSRVKNFQPADLQNSRGEWMQERKTCACERFCQKLPFFVVVKSQGPLEAGHASATPAPSHFTPILKPPPFRYKAGPLLSSSFLLPPAPQASPNPQNNSQSCHNWIMARRLTGEGPTLSLGLHEVREESCPPK